MVARASKKKVVQPKPAAETTSKTVVASKAPKGHHPNHPPWIEMIQECIATNTEDARIGVSRPQIKKFVEQQYQVEIGSAQNTQLSKAIASGAEKGILALPKGPSGRVKLAPKVKADAAKENAKPASRTLSKKPVATRKPTGVKKSVAPKKPAAKKSEVDKKPAKTNLASRSTTKKTPATKVVTPTAASSKVTPQGTGAGLKTRSIAKPKASGRVRSPTEQKQAADAAKHTIKKAVVPKKTAQKAKVGTKAVPAKAKKQPTKKTA